MARTRRRAAGRIQVGAALRVAGVNEAFVEFFFAVFVLLLFMVVIALPL